MSLNITTIRNLELQNKDKKDRSPRESHHVYKHIRLNRISHKRRHELRRFHLLQSGKKFGDNPMTSPDRNIYRTHGKKMSASVQNFTFACLAGHKYRKPDIHELVDNRQNNNYD